MKKKDILKMHGLSEAEFYKRYPTREVYEMAFGGVINNNAPDFANPGYLLMQDGGPNYGATTFPTFNSRSAYDAFKAKNPNFALYSDADMEGLGVNIPAKLDMNKVKSQNKYPYTPAGQTASGAGLFSNSQGQQFTFVNGEYVPYVSGVSPIVSKKMGGDNCYPGQTQNSIIDQKKNEFTSYIKRNTVDAIAREEADNAYGFLKMCMGGAKRYAQDGAEVEGSPENDAFWANMYGETATNNQMPANNQPFDWNFAGANTPAFSTPGSVGMHTNNIEMNGQTDKPYPYATQKSGQKYNMPKGQYRSMEPEANWIMAGMSKLSSILELRDAKAREKKFKELQGADNQFYSDPGGDRGDYDQFGNFRPNDKVPVQFTGYNTHAQKGSPYVFEEGGEYYMNDDQINAIRDAGGDIEFLD